MQCFVFTFGRKFTGNSSPNHVMCGNEQALLTWVNEICRAGMARMLPDTTIPRLLDLGDVGDGRCLAAVLSFYHPDALPLSGWFILLGVLLFCA